MSSINSSVPDMAEGQENLKNVMGADDKTEEKTERKELT